MVVVEEPLQRSEESVLKSGLLSPLKTWPQVVSLEWQIPIWKNGIQKPAKQDKLCPQISGLRVVKLYHMQVLGG